MSWDLWSCRLWLSDRVNSCTCTCRWSWRQVGLLVRYTCIDCYLVYGAISRILRTGSAWWSLLRVVDLNVGRINWLLGRPIWEGLLQEADAFLNAMIQFAKRNLFQAIISYAYHRLCHCHIIFTTCYCNCAVRDIPTSSSHWLTDHITTLIEYRFIL